MEAVKENKHYTRLPKGFNHSETFFRLIDPEDYPQFGIDPQDVPMGTFASEDHPGFLPSRFGGNAYGLGLIEQSVLTNADTEFLENIDFQDAYTLGLHAKQLNAIYQKLGLLIRFGSTGKPYFLVPINLVAHSLQEIKAKADEIEEQIIRHIWETRTERLEIGLLTAGHDLIVHELTARLSSHRIVLFESLDKLRSWRMPLDIIILPKDIFEYLLEQKLPKISRRTLSRQRLLQYAMYLAGKCYDLLESNGRFLVLAHSPLPMEDETCHVRFKTQEDLKSFLLFAHIFQTRRAYRGSSSLDAMEIHISDLHYYLGRFAFSEPHLKQLLGYHRPEELSIEEINGLPYLNLKLPQTYIKNPEKPWRWIFEPYFTTLQLRRKSPRHHHQYWLERLEIDRELPENLLVFVGQPRQPEVDLSGLDEETRAEGMQGCSLSLVADYRNSFRFVLDVLDILIRIRDGRFLKLSELERARLTNPFRSRSENFQPVVRLLSQIGKLEKLRDILNPDSIEGQVTPILENIPKLSLHGFSAAQLRELLLIVTGHTTMSRIVLGKLPAKTLKPITDRAREGNYQDILDLLRVCRLMSVAEIVAALGDAFTGEQAKELYRLYDDAIYVATDPGLTWEKLHDLRISAVGGVQNKAIREMLKLFNLFEFLDSWQELSRKGGLEKEVICDYEPEQLAHLEDALELARIANQFKKRLMGDYIFGQSFFFRQFLETEFHGTGHLFPELGTTAGFILLWVAVNSSERHIVNFNPMLAGISPDGREQRIANIKESLLRIPIERLHPEFFEGVKRTLAENRPAFIFDSGIRLIINPETKSLDVSFVGVDEDIQQIEALLTHFQSQRLRGISLKNMQELERLFSELESFHRYLGEEGCSLQCNVFEREKGVQIKDSEIGRIELRLKAILQSQIFIPEEIYDTINGLAKHCPQILRFVLPEFYFPASAEGLPAPRAEHTDSYIMRILEKFQALINKDRNAFQDRNTFYQLAKQEFGPLAEEGIGASHAQMDILEYLVDRIQQRPMLYQALTLALLFRDMGKKEGHTEAFPEIRDQWIHSERGALLLEKSDTLKKYHLDPEVERLIIQLIRYQGLTGQVIHGEEPIPALGHLTAEYDDRILDGFILHDILAAAAVQENHLVSDLLDLFLGYRAMALQIIEAKGNWKGRLREVFREEGEAVLADFQLIAHEAQVFPSEFTHYCGLVDEDIEDAPLWHGRQIAALERLLKLMGIFWVDYQDLQMHLLKMPVNFIYHKKKLKSVGPASFERELRSALKLLYTVSLLNPEVRYYLLYCLDHLGGAMRIHGFRPLTGLLEMEESLKLLLFSFQTFHHHFGLGTRGGLITFEALSQDMEKRHEILKSLLRKLAFPERCLDGVDLPLSSQDLGDLHFRINHEMKAIRLEYRKAVEFESMVDSLKAFWDYEALEKHYRGLIQAIKQKLPYDTKTYEEELQKAFEEQEKRISDRVLKTIQKQLSLASSFSELQEVQKEIRAVTLSHRLSEEQEFNLQEFFDFHRSRLRDQYLGSVYRDISAFSSRESLIDYWNMLKYELFSYRSFVGKEYESLIAKFIDEKLENFRRQEKKSLLRNRLVPE